jgi:flagellar hook-associated protein 1 FlgK
MYGGALVGFELGKRALLSQQLAMNIIGHNIANVNTPGFSRQQAVLQSTYPLDTTLGKIGTGIEVNSIRRLRELFLDTQFRQENQSLGKWSSVQKTLSQVETIFNEPSDTSLGALLDKFWSSWQELSTNPESQAARSSLREQAQLLTNAFHNVSSLLNDLKESLNEEISAKVTEINSIGEQIATLNDQIAKAELSGQKANDLRDKRDYLVDKLSQYAPVKVVEQKTGAITVYFGSLSFVEGNSFFSLEINQIGGENQALNQVIWNSGIGEVKFPNGELQGLIEARDEIIPNYLEKLNGLASGLVNAVNVSHRKGFGLDGSTNINFFDPDKISASNICLSDEILNDLNKIIASESGAPGDNKIALEIAGLKDARVLNNGTSTLNDIYKSIIGILGARAQESNDLVESQQLLVNQIENSRQSVQGVSIDEEMANLVKFQRAYEAAARVITTMDEALITIINGVGVTR